MKQLRNAIWYAPFSVERLQCLEMATLGYQISREMEVTGLLHAQQTPVDEEEVRQLVEQFDAAVRHDGVAPVVFGVVPPALRAFWHAQGRGATTQFQAYEPWYVNRSNPADSPRYFHIKWVCTMGQPVIDFEPDGEGKEVLVTQSGEEVDRLLRQSDSLRSEMRRACEIAVTWLEGGVHRKEAV